MSKSVLLKSSLAKKYWMALTGLFLCTFLLGHLAGNLQLLQGGEEGRRAFNEYAAFMAHNPFIKLLSYVTYISILFHAIDGIMLAVQNKKARPNKYAYTRPNENSSPIARNMAVLGTMILIFIVTHMANFWYKAKISSEGLPLHTVEIANPQNPMERGQLYLTTTGSYIPVEGKEIPDEQREYVIKNKTEIYSKSVNLKIADGYKDLHSLTVAFFGQDRSQYGFPVNQNAIIAVVLYVVSMAVLGFHLWHGFASAFQSLGLRHKKYTSLIQFVGKLFSIAVPALFALIPIFIYLNR